MSTEYYVTSPYFKAYFEQLPKAVQSFIVASGAEFSTLGELQLCAEHLMKNNLE